MIQPVKKQEVPAELLSVLISLASAVIPLPGRNSQIRFWWPAKGTTDADGKHIGQYRAVSTGQRSDKISKEKKHELIAAWFMQNGFTPKPAPKEGSADIESEIEEYVRSEYEAKGHPLGTVRPIRQALRRLRETLAKGDAARKIRPVFMVPEITAEAFAAAVPKLKLRELAPRPGQTAYLKPKGWKNLFGNIHPFIEWEIRRGNLNVDPTLGTVTPTKAELKKSRPVRTVWPDAEYEATLAKINFRKWKLLNGEGRASDWTKVTRFTVKMLRWGGVDVNETFRLRANHIDEDSKGHLWIRKPRGKSKPGAIEMIKLPVSTKYEKELREYWIAALAVAPDAHVLPWHNRFTDHASFAGWLFKVINRARKAAGLPPRNIKSFRHTFTTHHLKAGKVKIAQLREWLGHADDSRMIEDTYDLSEYGTEAMN